jgi:hypothetical protein
MRFSYLVALMLAGCPSAWSSTLITASSTCEIDQPGPVFTDSHTVTLSAPTNMINGLDCTSPYGAIIFSSSRVIDSINLLGPTVFGIDGSIDLIAKTATPYRAFASLKIHLFSQDTYIPSGGSGAGFISGTSGGAINGTGLNLVTPFGTCSDAFCPMLGFPFSIPFVFGQPLTITVTGDLSLGINSVPGDFADSDVNVAVGSIGVFDATGKPISATFTPAPEPAAWLSGISALLLIVLFRQLKPIKNPLPLNLGSIKIHQ